MAAQFSLTNGLWRRELSSWTRRATSSFPVPVSPWTSTTASVGATISVAPSTRRRPMLVPTISSELVGQCRAPSKQVLRATEFDPCTACMASPSVVVERNVSRRSPYAAKTGVGQYTERELSLDVLERPTCGEHRHIEAVHAGEPGLEEGSPWRAIAGWRIRRRGSGASAVEHDTNGRRRQERAPKRICRRERIRELEDCRPAELSMPFCSSDVTCALGALCSGRV